MKRRVAKAAMLLRPEGAQTRSVEFQLQALGLGLVPLMEPNILALGVMALYVPAPS